MYSKTLAAAGVVLAASAIIAGPASAAVSIDPATGTGFVGKGDVQTAFGWNNKVSQTNYHGVTFGYDASAQFSQDCEKTFSKEEWQVVGHEPVYNKQGTLVRYDDIRERVTVVSTIDKTFRKSASVSTAVAWDAKRTGQMTGYNLRGFVNNEGSLAAPADLCTPGVGEDGQSGWSPAVAEDGTVSTVVWGAVSGGLTVTYGGVTKPLPNTPVV